MAMNRALVILVLALTVSHCAQLAAAACPALTINFFPDGSKNAPAGWTREAQVAAGNEDTASLNTIKLTATPPPKLFVQPMHPLFSRKACVPADCLQGGKGRRLQGAVHEARFGPLRPVHAVPAAPEDDAAAAAAAAPDSPVAELQRWDAEAGGLSKGLSPFFWNMPYNPFGKKAAADSKAASAAAAKGASSAAVAPASTGASQGSAGSSIPELGQAAAGTDTGDRAPSSSRDITDASTGSGSSGLKDGIGSAGGDGSNFRTGWTTWIENDDSWWSPEDRSLQACTTTVAQPASYDILWNIDGGVPKKATMPKQGAPFIELSNLDTLAPGKHTLNIKATMLKGTSEVNGVPQLQPPADQVYTTKVVFNLVEGKGTADGPAVEPSDPKAAAGAAKPAAPAAPGDKAAAAQKPAEGAAAPGEEVKAPAAAEGEAKPAEEKRKGPEVNVEPTVDAAVAQQAVKYYCMRQYNVGGKIHSQKNVSAGDEGINQCAVACNALRADCGGFGVSGNKCFLMKAFNGTSSAADATLDALCMKSANDWLDFGLQTSANQVGAGFFCLRGYDIKGDPAGTGDMENPVQTANTELAGMTTSTCATQCRATAGCQYFITKKPTIVGGTATCYLKMHALGGLYGNTGPSKETIDFTCFNGQEQWITFGSQLDYAVPSPEVNTGVQTPALAAVTPAGGSSSPLGPAGAKTYRCIKGYLVNGTSMGDVQVSMGDEGLSQCAGKCDTAAGCVAYSMTEAGACTMLKDIAFNVSSQSPNTYGMCFGSAQDWNKFGNPDGAGMYCVKQYDFAGDGVRMVDYITITTGAGAVQFCKQQCLAEPQCQFSVTSLGKCYMKQNILSGSFGTTRPNTAVDASCVKGEANWALAALQVSAAPPGGSGPMAGRLGVGGNGTRGGVGNMGARKTSLRSAADGTHTSLLVVLTSAVVAVVLSVCLLH